MDLLESMKRLKNDKLNCFDCMYYEEWYEDQYGGLMNQCNKHDFMGFITNPVCDDFVKYRRKDY